MKNFELEITNATENPIDAYVERLQTMVPPMRFEMNATEVTECPTFTIVDEEKNYFSTLRRAQEVDFVKIFLTVTDISGNTVMSSSEWTTPDNSDSPLRTLYNSLYDISVQQVANEQVDPRIAASGEEVDPGAETPESLLIDDFIAALTADVKSPHPVIHWEKAEPDSDDEYVAYGFGDSQCRIRLTKNRLDETGATFTLKYEDFNGTEVFSSIESSVRWEDSEIGELYRLVANMDTSADVTLPMQDAERFANRAKVAAIFDRIVDGAFASICQPNPETGENLLLVHDIFTEANLNVAVRYALDEIKKRTPELSPSRMLQLQTQAECIGKIIRHAPRCPNGAVFKSDVLPAVICNGTAWKGETVTASDNLGRISNAAVAWLDILGSKKQMSLQRTLTKHASILLTIIMMEQMK